VEVEAEVEVEVEAEEAEEAEVEVEEAEVEAEEAEVEAEVEEEEVVAEGYLQEECHLQAEPHLFTASWEEIPQPNSMETGRKVVLFSSHLHCIGE